VGIKLKLNSLRSPWGLLIIAVFGCVGCGSPPHGDSPAAMGSQKADPAWSAAFHESQRLATANIRRLRMGTH
jgi:hypothetical protein